MFRENCYAWVFSFSFSFFIVKIFFLAKINRVGETTGNDVESRRMGTRGWLKSEFQHFMFRWEWLAVLYTKRFLKNVNVLFTKLHQQVVGEKFFKATTVCRCVRIFYPFPKKKAESWHKHNCLFMTPQFNRITLLVVARAFYSFNSRHKSSSCLVSDFNLFIYKEKIFFIFSIVMKIINILNQSGTFFASLTALKILLIKDNVFWGMIMKIKQRALMLKDV